ncbi:hypothetical protein HMN09_00907700 [Mycena chlorophos]|uniref:Uncharacterized protein n=1 Tax=Mycena chlorophos TaxID=658473 RepID=A0A8H6SN68_MYCCL|nr:hypothetical protein HMN09_00907700 [Mycena chlorophos]
MFEIVQRPFAPAYGRSDSRESRISRIGSWILTPKRKAPRPPSGEQKLWDNSDAELGLGSQAHSRGQATDTGIVAIPVAEKSPMKETLADEKPRTPLAVNTTQPPEPPASATLEVTTPSTDTRPHTGVSFSSYYGMATASRLTLPSSLTRGQGTRGTDSPIYGLDGIIPPPAPESPILSSQPNPDPDSSFLRPVSSAMSTMTALQRTSGNSFDELLRQQTELDKSIAALRLFSSSSGDTLDPSPVEVLTRESKVTEPRSISMSSAKSKGSEFSLSVFPDPPLVNRASELPETLMGDLPFPRRMQSRVAVPTSATSDLLGGGLHGRFDSGATQYEITSFIGDLTIPGLNPGHSSDHSESDIETPVITTAQPSLRPLFLSSTSPAITSLPSNPAVGLNNNNSGSPTGTSGSSASPSHEYPILRPLLLGSTVPSVPSPLSAGARRTPGGSFGRKASSASATRRPTISGPKQVEDDDAEQAAAAFVSPRPAPVHK